MWIKHVFIVSLAMVGAASLVGAAPATQQLTQALRLEPAYRSQPQYSRMLLGTRDPVLVWMVEDGRTLYVDQNANGDLTDDGPPIEPSDVRELGHDQFDFSYVLDAITPYDGSRHTRFELRRWNYGADEDSYGLSIAVNGSLHMYAGWFGSFWSTNRETTPLIHFGGPVSPTMLRSRDFVVGSGQRRLSIAFVNPGSSPGARSRFSIEALPAYVVPRLNIEWPTTNAAEPLRTSHDLVERCCYWEFYTSEFQVPEGVVEGTANVSVEFPVGSMPLELTTTNMEVSVVKPSARSQPLSE